MSWCRAVWQEPQKNGKLEEFEMTLPQNWVRGTKVFWPNKMNVTRAFRYHDDPSEDWNSFKLVKIKVTGDKDLCDTYGEEVTTSYEDDDENNERENYDLRVESAEREISMLSPKSNSPATPIAKKMPVFSKSLISDRKRPFSSSKKTLLNVSNVSDVSDTCSPTTSKRPFAENMNRKFLMTTANVSDTCSPTTSKRPLAENVNSKFLMTPAEVSDTGSPTSSKRPTLAENVNSKFPMTTAKFQKTVMATLADIKSNQSNILRRLSMVESEKDESLLILDALPVKTLQEFKQFEADLDDAKYKQLVKEMMRIGGKDEPSCVRQILNRIMVPSLQAQFNLNGSVKKNITKKEALGETKTYKAILKAVKKTFHKANDSSIRATVSKILKYVPDRVRPRKAPANETINQERPVSSDED